MLMAFMVPIAIVVFESLCQILFLNTLLERRENRKDTWNKILMAVILILFNTVFAALFSHTDAILNIVLRWVVFSFLVFVVARIFYHGKTLHIAAISSLVFIVVQFSDFIGLSVMNLLGVDVERIYELSSGFTDMVSSLGVSVAIKLVLLVVVLLIRYMMSVFGKQYYATRIYMKTRNWLLILAVPIMGILSIWILSVLTAPEKHANPLFLLLSVGWLFVSFIVAHTVFVSSAYEQQLREHMIMQEKIKYGEKYYSIERRKYEQMQSLQHDVSKHFMFIKECLRKGNATKALRYIESVTGDDSRMISKIDTNNEAVNIVLNEKINRCKERGIGLVFQINDLSAIPLEDKDIVVVLTNILDNAIEASEKCEGRKAVHIKFIHSHDQIVLSVKNPYKGKLLVQGDKLLTSKTDDSFHGVGITSVANCLAKYNGVYAFNGDKNQFQFSAIIPAKQIQSA